MAYSKTSTVCAKEKIKWGVSLKDIRLEIPELGKLTLATYKKWYKEVRGQEYSPSEQLPRPRCIAKITLKTKYKMSDAWIKRLGRHDVEVPNPIYKVAAPMKLYYESRVIAFIDENIDEYLKWLERREKYSARQKQVQDELRKETIRWAETVNIVFDNLPEDLFKAAQQYFEAYDYEGDNVNFRGVLAFMRHAKTNYHELLSDLINRTGRSDCVWIIKQRVELASVNKIAETYGIEFIKARHKELLKKYPQHKESYKKIIQTVYELGPDHYGEINKSEYPIFGAEEAYALAKSFMYLQYEPYCEECPEPDL